MKEPTTAEEVKELHMILRKDPQKYLQIVNEWLSINPENAHALFDRHLVWMRIDEPRNALADMNAAIAIDSNPMWYFARAEVFKHIGAYEKALDDFATSEALMSDEWDEMGFGLLQQADCYARLGDEDNALRCCARLGDDFWTPGLNDAPAGDKIGIAARLRLIADEARRSRGG